MPYALSVFPADRLGVVRLTGTVTGGEVAAAAAELADRPNWQGYYRALWDASAMIDLDLTFEDLSAIVAQERDLRTRGERGELVVVVRDGIWASLVKLFTLRMRDEARRVTVLPTTREAHLHLGVDRRDS